MAERMRRRARATAVAAVVVVGVALLSACTPNTGVAGIVTANGTSRPGILIELFESGTTNRIAATTTASDGSYELDFVTPGDYDIRFAGTLWYDGTPTAGPVPVAVPVALNAFTPVDADVAIGTGAISGQVKTSGGDPAVGVTVDAVDKATGLTIATTTSDEAGEYTLGALPTGTYTTRYTSATTPPRWYVSAVAAGDAEPVYVFSDQETILQNVQLSVGRSITGTVTDYRNPVPGAVVAAFSQYGSFAALATTGADGTFTLAELNSTSYRLLVYPKAPLRPTAWMVRNDPDVSSGPLIDVTAGDIDAGTTAVTACDPATFHPGADLTAADLHGADLTGCDLSGALIAYADVNGADFFGASLRGATLGTVEMQDADLSGTDVTDLFACGIGGQPILPATWQKVGSCLVGPTANLTQAPLDGFDLSGLDLTGANLTEAGLQNSNLTGANLTDVNLQGIDLSHTTLTGVISSGITGTPYRLPDGWALIGGVLVGP